MSPKKADDLPTWFLVASKIAKHCVYGVCILFILLQLNWTNEHINKKVLECVNVFLVLVAVPTFILSGADIVKIILKILNAFRNDYE
jgi:hypothetical protein